MDRSRASIGFAGFDNGREFGMISRCLPLPNPKLCSVHTDFVVFVPKLVFAGSSVIRRPVFSLRCGSKKNAVRFLWRTSQEFLRPHPGRVRDLPCGGMLPYLDFEVRRVEFRRFFENWPDSLKWQRLKPYEKFAEMIDHHWDGIAAYCKPENKVSLGFVEGLNNKIRVIQRRAYGLRDEEYLRPKILTCMLPAF